MPAPPRPDDAALVAAARRGDRRAFAELIERHHPQVLATCRRMTGDREAAAEAAQEAVVQALLGLDHLRDDARFGAWLTGIALNVCRRALRERGGVPGSLGELAAQAPGPAELAEGAALAVRVRGAIAALPPGQRRAVFLFYLAGLTHAEVADHLAIRVGAVKTRLHKARSNLARRLIDLKQEELPMTEETTTAVPMEVTDVRRTAARLLGGTGPRHVVLLEETGGDRRLPIWVGPTEAAAMTIVLQDVELPRPGPYHLASSLLAAAGARLREVRISRLTDATFYAVAVLADGTEVDARPSDAITLALLAGAPILVEEAVLAETGRLAGTYAEEIASVDEAEADARAMADEARELLAANKRELAEYAARAREAG